MSTSPQQRKSDLEKKRPEMALSWSVSTASVAKDLAAPIFKKLPDIAALAKRFDAAIEKFQAVDKLEDKAGAYFESLAVAGAENDAQSADLAKELMDATADAKTSYKKVSDPKDMAEAITKWEELQKADVTLAKEAKAIRDRMNKLDDSWLKLEQDTIARAKKDAAGFEATRAAANNEMNALETQIRNAVVAYQKVAIDMSRKDIADRVRGFLSLFA